MQKETVTKAEIRAQSLMPAGVPRYVRCYDNNGDTFDRYTIVFTRLGRGAGFPFVGSSVDPYHPQGYYVHGEGKGSCIDRPTSSHLGKKIKFADLPKDVQKAVINDYKAYWQID